jgi:hypothetical protein
MSTSPCAATTRLRPHALYVNLAVRCEYSSPGCTGSTSTLPCAASTRLRPHVLYLNLAVRRDYSSPGHTCSTSTSSCTASTTPPPPRIWVPRHVARLVTWLVAPLVVDYFASAARPGASARRAARRRLLRLRRASGCLGTSRGSSSTTSPPPHVRVPRHVAQLVVDYFAFAARPGASHVARLVMPLVVDYSALPSLVVDYFADATRPGASARRAARHATHRRLLCAPRLRLAATLALPQPCRAS